MKHLELNDLQRRIVAALQIDGRATWRKIATVLGEPERTVARYGSELIDSGMLTVAAVQQVRHSLIVTFSCAPGTARLACESLAQRVDTTYSYMTTGPGDVVAEILYEGDMREILMLQLPATPGLNRMVAYPVLKYFRTIRGWRVGALNPDEERALTPRQGTDSMPRNLDEPLSPKDRQIIDVLRGDGRSSIEAIARQTRMSDSSVSRRLSWLLDTRRISIRTLVEPSLAGLPVEALLFVQTSPHRVDELGKRLAQRPEVRYAAAVAGDCQLIVDVTVATQADLYSFISDAMWGEQMTQVKAGVVIQARKRGGRLLEPS